MIGPQPPNTYEQINVSAVRRCCVDPQMGNVIMTTSNTTKRTERDFHLLAITTANLIVLMDDFLEIVIKATSIVTSFFGG